MRPRLPVLCSAVLLAAAPVVALEPYLVKDINPVAVNPDSSPRDFATLDNGVALFVADSLHLPQLWRSDGTAVGTYQLSEPTCEGLVCEPTRLRTLAHAGDRLFFLPGHYQANGRLRGLWITDGTKPGTFPVADVFIYPFDRLYPPDRPPVWVKSRGLLFFPAAATLTEEEKLWRSDGTPGGTYPLGDLWDSPELTEFRGKLYFSGSDRLHGSSLWVSDGSIAGTKFLKDLDPSSPSFGSPWLLRSIGPALVFFNQSGTVLWRSDGTAKGTVPIAKFPPAPAFRSYVIGVTSLNGRYYFGLAKDDRGEELWVSDGTSSGTRQLTNFVLPDALSSYGGGASFPLPTRAAGSRVIFRARDSQHGIEPWVTDGTPKGTRLLKDICPGTCDGGLSIVTSFGSRLVLYAADPAHGAELWISDGTPAGTRLIRDVCLGPCGSHPRGTWELRGKLIFQATDLLHGPEIWKSDGTPRGTVRITDLPFDRAYVSAGVPIPGAVLFSAEQSPEGHELWRTDGTAEGTYLLRDIADQDQGGSTPYPRLATADRLYFVADDGLQQRYELWASDGTGAGTVQIPDFYPSALATAGGSLFVVRSVDEELELWRMGLTGGDTVFLTALGPEHHEPPQIVSVGNRVFVQNGGELWTSDGMSGGTHKLALGSDAVGFMASFQGRLVFTAGTDLWASDGEHTTLLLARFSDYRGPKFLGEHGGRLWFKGPAPGIDETLWSTDGTSHGTIAHTDFPIGMKGAEISLLISAGSRMFLTAAGSGSGKGGLWISEGTAAGTRRISSTVLASYISDKPAVLGGALFFWHWDGEATSLGRSDGTEAGTGLVLDASGEKIIKASWGDLAVAGGNVYFIRKGELWRTDGSPTGTVKVGARFPEKLTPAGGRLFFSAWDPATGRELWALDPQ